MNRIFLFLIASFSILACNDAGRYESMPATKDEADFMAVQTAGYATTAIDGFEVTEGGDYTVSTLENLHPPRSQAPSTSTSVARKLIRSGSMHSRVNSLDSARIELLSLLESAEGYISSESASSNYLQNLTFTLRIPEGKFDSFIFGVEGISSEVLSRNINVNDVTDQYVDIAARLSTKRALHTRYTQLLSKAKNVKEVIEVERELAKVLADIESSEARLKSLGDKAAYATLQLSFSTEVEPTAQAGFWSDLGDSLSAGWSGVKMAVLLGATLWPLALFGLALFFGIRWGLKRWKLNRMLS